jgi:DGQHR domain-containing protein
MKSYLTPLISNSEILVELRRRSKKHFEKTIKASTPELLEQKVLLEEQDGWERIRSNKLSYRLGKSKPFDEILEDELWCLCARMGFTELSEGRNFLIDVGAQVNPRQIDVFAKDDDVALFIECTTTETPKKKSMAPLIEKIASMRKAVFTSTQKQFSDGNKLKQRFIIATRNVDWSKADLAKAESENIIVLRDQELDYYAQLTKQLKLAAKYQFLANIFRHEDIPGLSIAVPASQGKMGGTTFYNFLISPKELLKIAFISHKGSKDAGSLGTYQRMLNPKRLKDIAQYVDNEGGRFPTNIVVNIDSHKRKLRFDKKEQVGDSSVGTLYLPSCYAAAWVIDGQHRLYGYALSKRASGELADSSVLPVLAYENLPANEQANMFVDINHKQVKVSKNLLIELFADLHWGSPDSSLAIVSLCSKTIKAMDEQLSSPIKGRVIQTGKASTHQCCLSLTSLSDGLKANKFFGDTTGKFNKHGPFTDLDSESSLNRAVEILSGYLTLFADRLPEQWELGNDKGGYIATNNAINSLYRVLREIFIHLDKNNTVSCDEKSPEELVPEIEKLITPVIKFLKQASPQDIALYRGQLGAAGQRKCAMDMMAKIQEEFADFQPEGLKEYLDANDSEGTKQSQVLVREIQNEIFNFVISKLKESFPETSDSWWVKGVPAKIRTECATNREQDPERLDPEQYLMLLHYKSIAASHWLLFKDSFSFKPKGNKEEQLKWLQELNGIRNIVSHPERGLLTKDQVAFVKEVHAQVIEKMSL